MSLTKNIQNFSLFWAIGRQYFFFYKQLHFRKSGLIGFFLPKIMTSCLKKFILQKFISGNPILKEAHWSLARWSEGAQTPPPHIHRV
jgi:hypothetical protein